MLKTEATDSVSYSMDAGFDFSVCERIIENVSRVVVGKHPVVELLLVALLAEATCCWTMFRGSGKP